MLRLEFALKQTRKEKMKKWINKPLIKTFILIFTTLLGNIILPMYEASKSLKKTPRDILYTKQPVSISKTIRISKKTFEKVNQSSIEKKYKDIIIIAKEDNTIAIWDIDARKIIYKSDNIIEKKENSQTNIIDLKAIEDNDDLFIYVQLSDSFTYNGPSMHVPVEYYPNKTYWKKIENQPIRLCNQPKIQKRKYTPKKDENKIEHPLYSVKISDKKCVVSMRNLSEKFKLEVKKNSKYTIQNTFFTENGDQIIVIIGNNICFYDNPIYKKIQFKNKLIKNKKYLNCTVICDQ